MVTMKRSYPSLRAIVVIALLLLSNPALNGASQAAVAQNQPAAGSAPVIQGPFSIEPVTPTVSSLPLREMPQLTPQQAGSSLIPLRQTPGSQPKTASSPNWIDPLAQTQGGPGLMPAPSQSFEGQGYDYYWPPDTVGDVGDTYFVQAVNISLGIYNKSTGARVSAVPYATFFANAAPPCNQYNSGDVVVVYDRIEQRWLVSDMSIVSPPYSECVAISQTGDPTGAWYFYSIPISYIYVNDYPKMGVWQGAYYLTFNMFTPGDVWEGVQVWALNKTEMLTGSPLHPLYFSLSAVSGYSSLLPAHALSAPAAGEPEYLASVEAPDQFQLWKFKPDFAITSNSVFTGSIVLKVPNFTTAAFIPQPGTTTTLDSLSYRPMMQLQYRANQGVASLWLNHTVSSAGAAAIRWYELRDPGGTPLIYQQGTYQPDSNSRWMGSLAVDKDGNMAVGYSLGSVSLNPSIAYSGRLRGEIPGVLPQGETVLVQGTGSQTTNTRWGDYSAMSLDPADDCTFWYTNEYYTSNGGSWRTRIGSFKYPSCGQPKGHLAGTVRDAAGLAPIPAVSITATSTSQTFTTLSNGNGYYTMTLTTGDYAVTAGPLYPGYPTPKTLKPVSVVAPSLTSLDISLSPSPHLIEGTLLTADQSSPNGNGNGSPEPGEQGIQLTEGLTNDGAAPASQVSARIASSTPGVVINTSIASYPDIAIGALQNNLTPFEFSLSSAIPCGTSLNFTKTITTSAGVSRLPFSLVAGIPLARTNVFSDTVESGLQVWTTGGVNNTWAITTEVSHSPTHSWTDSPGGNYLDNTNSYLQSPTLDLSDKRGTQISAWVTYALEPGYDFVYLDYSLDGGLTWNPTPLATYNAYQLSWAKSQVDASVLDNQPNVVIRYRLVSDAATNFDGIHIDDIAVSAAPYTCSFSPSIPDAPARISPSNRGFKDSPVTFQWSLAGSSPTPLGYHLIVDGSLVTTTNLTSFTLVLPLGIHTWNVTAFNAAGKSLPGPDWIFIVPRKVYLAMVSKN